jgi:glucokinase
VLRGLSEVRAEDVSHAAGEGDALARELWDETCALLASAITDLVNILEPDRVVLGGGVTRAGDALLVPVRNAVLRDAMPPAAKAVTVSLAGLGDLVCVVGAGALAFDLLHAAGPLPEVVHA